MCELFRVDFLLLGEAAFQPGLLHGDSLWVAMDQILYFLFAQSKRIFKKTKKQNKTCSLFTLHTKAQTCAWTLFSTSATTCVTSGLMTSSSSPS